MQNFSKNFSASGNSTHTVYSSPHTSQTGMGDDLASPLGMPSYRNTHLGSSVTPSIPEVGEWMDEHHFMANLFKVISVTKELLVAQGDFDNGEFHVTPEGQWILTTKAKEILKAHCHEGHWQYVENFLLA